MKRTLLAALVALFGCSYELPWEPAPLPARIYSSPELSDADRLAVADAAVWYEEQVDGILAGVTVAPPEEAPCGTIVVTYGCTEHLAETFSYDGCHTLIRMSRGLGERAQRAMVHELGHAFLGDEHSPEEGNVVMPGLLTGEPVLSEEQLDELRVRVDAAIGR